MNPCLGKFLYLNCKYYLFFFRDTSLRIVFSSTSGIVNVNKQFMVDLSHVGTVVYFWDVIMMLMQPCLSSCLLLKNNYWILLLWVEGTDEMTSSNIISMFSHHFPWHSPIFWFIHYKSNYVLVLYWSWMTPENFVGPTYIIRSNLLP